jgi:hypothetical protein
VRTNFVLPTSSAIDNSVKQFKDNGGNRTSFINKNINKKSDFKRSGVDELTALPCYNFNNGKCKQTGDHDSGMATCLCKVSERGTCGPRLQSEEVKLGLFSSIDTNYLHGHGLTHSDKISSSVNKSLKYVNTNIDDKQYGWIGDKFHKKSNM